MRLRWWEWLALAGPIVLGLLFLLGQLWLPGVVLLAVTAFTAASRAHIVERNVAGHHARVRGHLLLFRGASLMTIYVALVVLFFIMRRDEWTDEPRGQVAFYASAALAFYLVRDIWRYGNEALRWLEGGEAEQEVAAELEPLRAAGWLVVHNLKREGRGNLDHFVRGATGAYAIETKRGKYRATDRGQAVSNAIWARETFGERWVTPVLCVATDPPSAPRVERHGNATVWILGVAQLRRWILEQAKHG